MKVTEEKIIHVENGSYRAQIFNTGYWELFYTNEVPERAIDNGYDAHAVSLQELFTEIAKHSTKAVKK